MSMCIFIMCVYMCMGGCISVSVYVYIYSVCMCVITLCYDNDQEQLRPVHAVVPNNTVLTEVLLLSEGFLHSVILAKKMSDLWNMLKSQVSSE